MALVDAFLTALMSAGILAIASAIAAVIFKPAYGVGAGTVHRVLNGEHVSQTA